MPEKEKEQLTVKIATCGLSTVKSYRYLDFNGYFHAGTLVHVCNLPKDHKNGDQKKCVCSCGIEFYGWN